MRHRSPMVFWIKFLQENLFSDAVSIVINTVAAILVITYMPMRTLMSQMI